MRLTTAFLQCMLMLFSLSAPAVAQDKPDIGSVLISYNLSDLEPGATDRISGLSLEADLKIPGTVISFVGHISDHGEVNFSGVGPRVTHDLGPLSIFRPLSVRPP